MIAAIAVDLENAVESFEHPLGVLAAATRRVMIDHDRRIGAATPAVVAQNGPQIACLRPAAAGIENRLAIPTKPKLRSVRRGRRRYDPLADALPVQPVE